VAEAGAKGVVAIQIRTDRKRQTGARGTVIVQLRATAGKVCAGSCGSITVDVT
jgi:hypothetical protein